MEKPEKKILSILKINEQIKRNIFGLSFKDEIIEKEYIETEIKMNLIIKLILHFIYCYNYITIIITAKFRVYIYTTIIQAILSFFGIFSIIAYYVIRKNLKLKKFFDYASSYFCYFFQVIFKIHIFSYEELTDQVFRLKAFNILNYLTFLKILFSYESSIIFPFLILIINTTLIFMISIKYNELDGNLNFITVSLINTIASIAFKRYINDLNRKNFIEQYIFKKYSKYYCDMINNMNGYHFSMKSENILKYNENYKIDILNQTNYKEKILENELISTFNKMKYSKNINNLNCLSKNKEENLILKAQNNFNKDKNENEYIDRTHIENEFTINFLKSLTANKIELKKKYNSSEYNHPNLFELYILIERYDNLRLKKNENTLEISKNLND